VKLSNGTVVLKQKSLLKDYFVNKLEQQYSDILNHKNIGNQDQIRKKLELYSSFNLSKIRKPIFS